MKEQFKTELTTVPISFFISKWMLERSTPYLFNGDHLAYLQWKEKLAYSLGVDSCSLLFIGTAGIGVSLNPNKNFSEFGDESDIDIAVISPYHFEESWRFLRSLGSERFKYTPLQQMSIKEHVSRFIYWGTIATDRILQILPFGKEWQLAIDKMTKVHPTEGRDIKLRIYKDFEALRAYHTNNLIKLRDELLQSTTGAP